MTGFRMRYGVPAFLLGWLVTFLTFCVVVSIVLDISSLAGGMGGSIGIVVFGYAVLFGVVPAVVVGMPLAALTAWPLQRIRNQWWHVAVHALVTGTVATVIALVGFRIGDLAALSLVFALFAFSAAAGRASVIKLVARRNAR